MSDAAPTQWIEMSLAQLLGPDSLFCDGDWVESRDQDTEGENRLIQLADIGDGRFLDKSDRFMNDGQFIRLRCTALHEGDILIARMPDPIGRACLFPAMNTRCATVVDVAILRKAKAHPKWLVAAINSDSFRRSIEINSCGTTRTRISRGFLTALKLLVPPLETQKYIACVLDCIDTTIEKTEALITKYQQIKTGLMHDLFTRGVLPNGQLRPTREQAPELYQETAIGWIPKDWGIGTLTEVSHVSRGKFTHRPRNDPDYYGGPYPFIQTGDVSASNGGLIYTYSQTLSKRGTTVSQCFPGGTIAVTIAANIADTGILGLPMFFPDSVVGVAVNPTTNCRFVELCIRRAKHRLDAMAPQSAQKNINLQDLRPLKIPLPSRMEQDLISTRFEVIQAKINAEKDAQVKLALQKLGLMQDLLTGKVQVKIDAPEPAHA